LSVIGHFQEKTTPGTVQALTPSNPVTPLSSDPSRYDTMNYAMHESEGAQVEEAVMEQEKEIDPLDTFLTTTTKSKVLGGDTSKSFCLFGCFFFFFFQV
jgi:hypothetical protein